MSTSIHDTCKKLLDRNFEPAWVWSMLLGQGLLTWDNVWEAFPVGVLANAKHYNKEELGVQSPHMLLSLPNSPTTIVDVFQRLEEIHTKYPYKGYNSYDVLTIRDLSKRFIQATHGFVQCTWPQVKEVLELTKNDSGVMESNLLEFFNNLDDEHPKMLDKSLVYMVQHQHAFTATPTFLNFVHGRGQEMVNTLWDEVQTQQWAEPQGLSTFLATYALSGHKDVMSVPAMEALSFIEKHPTLLPDIALSIVSYGEQHPEDDLFFNKASVLLAVEPKHAMALTTAMKRGVSLNVLQESRLWLPLQTGAFELKPLLQAYLQMDHAERDSKEAAKWFSQLFSNVQVHTEEYLNGHSNDLMTKITKEHPTGSVARMLALHACIVGLYPEGHSDKSIKQLKAMFKHDPRSNTGFASIIKKCIPDMKAWLGVAESIGLSRDDIWEQGLHQLANPLVASDLDLGAPIDNSVFEA